MQHRIHLIWPSEVRGAPGPHKDSLHPPAWIHVGQTNLFSKWFATWLMVNVLPQIKKGDLVILWQISRRRAWKAWGSSFHWTERLCSRYSECGGASLTFSLYSNDFASPKGRSWCCVEVGLALDSAHHINCIKWDQFRPGRAWTLINLSPPKALNIQFKGPAID